MSIRYNTVYTLHFQEKYDYFTFLRLISCVYKLIIGDQLNESIFLPPFSVIFEQSKTFNFWEFVEFFLLILSGWMIGVIATHYYYFGFASSRKLGYKEVPMNDLSSDEEGNIQFYSVGYIHMTLYFYHHLIISVRLFY